jgi:hypothetical protein
MQMIVRFWSCCHLAQAMNNTAATDLAPKKSAEKGEHDRANQCCTHSIKNRSSRQLGSDHRIRALLVTSHVSGAFRKFGQSANANTHSMTMFTIGTNQSSTHQPLYPAF